MRPIHILLAEDNEGDILLTAEALENESFVNQLSVVRNGKEVIDFLATRDKYEGGQSPDLLLLDVNLPKMNGHQVLKFIKESPELNHIPVIMLSTSSSPSDIELASKNNVNCFITKPPSLDDFSQVVTAIKHVISFGNCPFIFSYL